MKETITNFLTLFLLCLVGGFFTGVFCGVTAVIAKIIFNLI